jgi:ribonuclease HII
MWSFEQSAKAQGYTRIAGIDEAGRGPLAGPVVSAAVILPHDFSCKGINDSKKLTANQRNKIFPIIRDNALGIGIGIASPEEIDRINILNASLLSMKRAVEKLVSDKKKSFPDFLLIDGKFTIDMEIKQKAIVKGDSKSISIAAASIIAKVTRDAIMEDLHRTYPAYGFIRHKGYPTRAHKQAICDHGPCPVHRFTFKGVKEFTNARQ